MADFTSRPIDRWPGADDPERPTANHYRRSKWSFSAGYDDTLKLLEKEVNQLGARGIVVVAERDEAIRLESRAVADMHGECARAEAAERRLREAEEALEPYRRSGVWADPLDRLRRAQTVLKRRDNEDEQ